MLFLTRQTAAARLACPAASAAQAIRYSSSSHDGAFQLLSDVLSKGQPVKEATIHSTGPLPIPKARADTRPRRHDPGLEKRRAAREAREAAAKKSKEGGITKNTPDKSPKHPQREHRAQSSRPRSGTERSRHEASKPGAAEAIIAISQREAEMRVEAIKAVEKKSPKDMETDNKSFDDPKSPHRFVQFTGPEPIPSNLDAMFNTTPGATLPIPVALAPRKHRKVSLDWVKRTYGGDYSESRSSTQDYMKGAQGPQSSYAKIILEHNHSIPLDDRRRLLSVIQQMTRVGKPKPTTKA